MSILGYTSSVHAQTTSSSQPTLEQVQQQSTKVQTTLAGFGQVLICQLVNRDALRPGYDCEGKKISTLQGNTTQSAGVLGMVLGGITTMYQPPINAGQSLQYFAGNFGLIKPVQAQEEECTNDTPQNCTNGSFQAFTFIQPMYLTLRNISYMLLIIVFIFIGMAIMLRFKIDPRTAMSIQNQLPKIVIGIILITFSYAIAGLLVDGMWALTYFGVNTIGNVAQAECGTGNGSGDTFAKVASNGLLNNPIAFTSSVFADAGCFGSFDGIGGLSKDVGYSMGGAVSNAILEATGLNAPSAHNCDPGLTNFGDVGDCAQDAVFNFLKFIIGVIAIIIVLVAIIAALFRLWIALIKAYVYILIDVITAPLQILMGLMPGGRMGFGKWLRHLTAYLLVFPASATVIILAISFALNKDLNSPNSNVTFYPPLIGIPGLSGNLGALIAFGLILVTPELLNMIKEAFQVKSNALATTAIQGGFGRGVGPTAALGTMGKELFGKNKDGNPRIGNTLVGAIGNRLGVSGKNAMDKEGSGWRGAAYRLTKRTQAKQEDARLKNREQDVSYQRQQARTYGHAAFSAHLRGNPTDTAGAHVAEQRANDEYLDSKGMNFSKPKTIIEPASSPSGGASTTGNIASQQPHPSGGAGAPATNNPPTQTAGLKKAFWQGDTLKDQADPTVDLVKQDLMTRGYTTMGGTPIPDINAWAKGEGYEIIT